MCLSDKVVATTVKEAIEFLGTDEPYEEIRDFMISTKKYTGCDYDELQHSIANEKWKYNG